MGITTKYKNTLVGCYNFIDFSNEYDIAINTFNTLIKVDKIFNVSFNGTNAERIELALNTIENYLYLDNGKNRYSVRKLATIPDKHCSHIYRFIIDLYDRLENISIKDLKEHPSIFKVIKSSVRKEVSLLEKVNFDYVVSGNIAYKKATNYYIMYISKLGLMYDKRTDFITTCKKYFYENYGISLDIKQMEDLILLCELIVKLNNGLIRLITKENHKYNNYTYDDYIDLYNDYLSNNLHIELDNNYFKDNMMIFFKEVNIITSNTSISIKEVINNYDFYYFLYEMEQIISNKKVLDVNSDLTNKIITDLTQYYNEIKNILPNDNIDKDLLINIYKSNKETLKRNKWLFERIG